MPKKKRQPEPYWDSIVKTLFEFYRANLLDTPSFDADQSRSLRMIVAAMRKRVLHSGSEWTEEKALRMLRVFLTFSFEDPWLRDNFLLFNLNRQKDKIFFRIKQYQIQKLNQQK